MKSKDVFAFVVFFVCVGGMSIPQNIVGESFFGTQNLALALQGESPVHEKDSDPGNAEASSDQAAGDETEPTVLPPETDGLEQGFEEDEQGPGNLDENTDDLDSVTDELATEKGASDADQVTPYGQEELGDDDSLLSADGIEQAVTDEIAETVKENDAEELLNLATEAKISASSVIDLTKVIALCEQAEKKGLTDDNLAFCQQLRIASQLQRGLAIAGIFMMEDLPFEKLPRDWRIYRSMALEDLEAVTKENPDSAPAQLAIGRLKMLPDGDTDQAIAALDKAIELAAEEPNYLVEALKYRAELESDSSKIEEMLNRALELDPENQSLLTLIADHWASVKRYAYALELLEKAFAEDQENPEYLKKKAVLLAQLDRYEEGEAIFKDLMAKNPDQLMLKIEYGQLMMVPKPDEAIEFFTNLIEENPEISLFYYFRAIVYAQKKDYKKALKDVNRCLRSDSSFSEAIQLKAVIYLQQENFDDSLRLFETLRRRFPNDLSYTTQIAYVNAKKGNYYRALELLDKSLEKNENDIDLLRCKGDIYLMYGQYTEAIQIYEQILAEHPKNSGVLNNYSWLLSTSPQDECRNAEKALALAIQANELTYETESHIFSTLAAAYAENGQFDQARQWSEKAVALGEKTRFEKIEDLKKELESYQKDQPWREIPEKSMADIQDQPSSESEKKPSDEADLNGEDESAAIEDEADSDVEEESTAIEEEADLDGEDESDFF